MFRIVTQYFTWLKYIPLMPHVFDALLKIQLVIFNRTLLDKLDDIEETVESWPNVAISMHKYGGTQFNLNNREIGHLHGNGLLDVPLNLSLKAELMHKYPVQDHHMFAASGWISFWIKDSNDKDLALQILQKAYIFQQSREALTTS